MNRSSPFPWYPLAPGDDIVVALSMDVEVCNAATRARQYVKVVAGTPFVLTADWTHYRLVARPPLPEARVEVPVEECVEEMELVG